MLGLSSNYTFPLTLIKEIFVKHLLCAEHGTGCSVVNKTGGAVESACAGAKCCGDELCGMQRKREGELESNQAQLLCSQNCPTVNSKVPAPLPP